MVYCTGISSSAPEEQLRIYLNPASSEIFIEGVTGRYSIELLDLSGRLLMSGALIQMKNSACLKLAREFMI